MKFDKNSTVYFYDTVNQEIIKGTIVRHLTQSSIIKAVSIVNTNGWEIEEIDEICQRNFENIFESPRKAYNAMKRKKNENIMENYDKIKTVEDLALFPLTNFLNEEGCINYYAVDAYKIRAKELLGVTI